MDMPGGCGWGGEGGGSYVNDDMKNIHHANITYIAHTCMYNYYSGVVAIVVGFSV